MYIITRKMRESKNVSKCNSVKVLQYSQDNCTVVHTSAEVRKDWSTVVVQYDYSSIRSPSKPWNTSSTRYCTVVLRDSDRAIYFHRPCSHTSLYSNRKSVCRMELLRFSVESTCSVHGRLRSRSSFQLVNTITCSNTHTPLHSKASSRQNISKYTYNCTNDCVTSR